MKKVSGCFIDQTQRRLSAKILLLTAFVFAFLFALLFFFPVNRYDFYPPCPWHKITGTYCPGCGTIRGLCSMIHGDFMGLARNNILAFLCLPFITYSYVGKIVETFWGYRLVNVRLSKIEIQIFVVIVILYWILRNFIDVLAPVPVVMGR